MSIQQMFLGAGGSAASEGYWYKNFNDSSTQEQYVINGKTVSTSDALYWAVVSLDGTHVEDGQSCTVIKMNKLGEIQWCSKLHNNVVGGDENINVLGMDADSSGNIYAAYTAGTTTSTCAIYIAKLDPSDGTLESFNNRYINPTGMLSGAMLYGYSGNSLWVDSNDNVYVTGKHLSTPGYILTMKYNSSGTHQWCTRIVQADASWASSLAYLTMSYTDSSGNTYVAGYRYDNQTGYNVFSQLFKYNSSGTYQWQAKWKSSDSSTWETCRARSICTDSSGNVYVGGETTDSGQGQQCQLTCINSSGTIQWHKTFTADVSTTQLDSIRDIVVDSDDKLYLTFHGGSGTSGGSVNVRPIVMKFNPSNQTIVWVRRWTHVPDDGSYGDFKLSIDTSGDDDALIVNYRSNEQSPFGDDLYGYYIWRLPVDGTLTGTYGDWSYVVPIDPDNGNAVITFGVASSDASTPSESNTTDTSGTYNSSDTNGDTTLDTSFDVNTLVSVS